MGDETLKVSAGCTTGTSLCTIDGELRSIHLEGEAVYVSKLDGKVCADSWSVEGLECGLTLLPKGLQHAISYLPGHAKGTLALFKDGRKINEVQVYLPATKPAEFKEWKTRLVDQASAQIAKIGDPVDRIFKRAKLKMILGAKDYVTEVQTAVTGMLLLLKDDQAKVLYDLAESLFWEGDTTQAASLAKIAHDLTGDPAEGSTGWYVSAILFEDLYARALARAQGAKDPSVQLQALRRLAHKEADRGDFDQAFSIAEIITDTGMRAWAYADIANAMARTQQFDRAIQVAETDPFLSKSPAAQARAFQDIAVALTKAGKLDRARQVAEKVGDVLSKGMTLCQIARTLGENKQFGQIEGVLERVQAIAASIAKMPPAVAFLLMGVINAEKAAAIAAITKSMVKAGEFHEAEAFMKAPYFVTMTADQLAEVGNAYAAIRQFGRAMEYAEGAGSPGISALELGFIAMQVTNPDTIKMVTVPKAPPVKPTDKKQGPIRSE